MISGAMRGKGGRALSRHLLKAENDTVHVIEPRGLGGADLHEQLDELVAMSLGGRTDRPAYHVHVDPDLSLALDDNGAARKRWWALFEQEFGLQEQPYCGAEHVKHGRAPHEHRVYSLVYPTGKLVDLKNDYARREKVSRRVEFEFNLAPVHSKHARTIEATLRREGHDDPARWIAAAGLLEKARPVAPLSPEERSQEERTNVRLADVQAAALAAWKASDDGPGFLAALRERGLRLHSGRAGPIVVDASGASHSLTRAIGVASKKVDGRRIPAAAVRARLEDVDITQHGGGDGSGDRALGSAGEDLAVVGGRIGAAGDGAGGSGLRRPGAGPGRPDCSGGDQHAPGHGTALDRLRALPAARKALLSKKAAKAMARGRHDLQQALSRIDGERDRQGNGSAQTDMWGVGRLG